MLLLCFLGFWHWREFWSRLNRRAQSCEVRKYNYKRFASEQKASKHTHFHINVFLALITSISLRYDTEMDDVIFY